MKDKKTCSLIFCLFFLSFVIGIIGCEPLEAITDTYADIVDVVSSEDNDGNQEVGKVIGTATFTGPNSVGVSYTVLNKNGEFIKDNTPVICSIFSVDDNATEFQITEKTTSGQISGCGITNAGIAESFIATATSEGISSEPISFTLGPEA